MMPTAQEGIGCPNCKSADVESAGRDRLRCKTCGCQFMEPLPAVPECPACGSACTVQIGPQRRCNACGKDFR
jgi:transposase-like protein